MTVCVVSLPWMSLCMCLGAVHCKKYITLHCIYMCWGPVWSWLFSFVGSPAGEKQLLTVFLHLVPVNLPSSQWENYLTQGGVPVSLKERASAFFIMNLLLHHKQLSTFILQRNTYFCACQRLGKSSPYTNCLECRMHNDAVTVILISLKELLFVQFVSYRQIFKN